MPRPLKLDPGVLLGLVAQAAVPMLVAIFIVAIVIGNHPLPDELAMLALGVAAFVFGVIRSRPFWLYRAFAREGEEVEADVIGAFEGSEFRLHVGNVQSRGFRLRVGDLEMLYEANDADEWPLFVDEERRRALVLRHGRRLLLIRNDFHPFDFPPDEEPAIRARIAQLQQVRKLLRDPQT